MNHNFDVIIVGGGAAGLYGAIQLPSYCKVLLICKQEMTLCNSSLAQGGIAGVYKSPEDDTPELHKQDTMIAGGFKNNPESVQILVEDAAMAIDSLLKLGADFDRKPDGSLHRTLEGGHCRHRIFHHKDTTGEEIVRTLMRKVKTLPNVTILESAMMVGLHRLLGQRPERRCIHNLQQPFYSAGNWRHWQNVCLHHQFQNCNW